MSKGTFSNDSVDSLLLLPSKNWVVDGGTGVVLLSI